MVYKKNGIKKLYIYYGFLKILWIGIIIKVIFMI